MSELSPVVSFFGSVKMLSSGGVVRVELTPGTLQGTYTTQYHVYINNMAEHFPENVICRG